MLYTTLLAVASNSAPTSNWSPTVGLVMILANLFAVIIGYRAIQNPGKGPGLPVGTPPLLKKFGFPELLATLSFGHIIGTGLILGLSNAGVL
ncbi:photosystem I reaction center subunit PsaK [Laspinema palackyanum]|uniref:Photosystem I reaction center subunit PsaK n=1 Tax=Laspinema palackyanum D2a TaxID=2953684 RepID=A0ABT2MP88_9CYAN|nr:photosystem I reaction center subunit PsaK [Laspinema sp. D2c]MCT7963141.1 photosystem I reaction center subunit PsaK [Laspinema sp. D2b]MCT7966528.1 photosystem I reaction center subunit PsaK [Laspinema sp. D2a]